MLSVNHTSGTTGEGMLNDLLKGKKTKPHPPSQQKRSSDGKSRKVNWTIATSYMLGKRSCNLIPVPVRIVPLSQFWPHPFPHPPITPFPPRYPSFLLARLLSNIQLKQQGVEVANWPLTVPRDELC